MYSSYGITLSAMLFIAIINDDFRRTCYGVPWGDGYVDATRGAHLCAGASS